MDPAKIGHYEIREKLGAGGMGEVFLARDTRLKRDVALKVLAQAVAGDAERLARFQREAEALAALNHPNIVTIYSVEEDGGSRLLTMERVEGRSLEEVIPAAGLALGDLLDVGVALADALAAAHGRGVVHRDLKPANVMITREGTVKVLDFGLAKLAEAEPEPGASALTEQQTLTQQGVVMGTIPYMSPEQLQGREVDARSDLFSLGVLLYEMAAGRRPFAGDSSPELMSAILRDAPAPLAVLRPELPRQLGRIVEHCLEKDVERRFQTAKDVRNELETLRSETTSIPAAATAVRLPALESGTGKAFRWRRAALAAAAVVGLASLGAFLLRPRAVEEVPGTRPGQARTLAVLPLENLSGDPEEEYLAQGLTDALIAELGKVSALDVVPRLESTRFRGSSGTLDEIAGELGADVLVDGSVQMAGGRVRINVEMIGTPAAGRLWSESYESEAGDLLVLQSRIAREITGQIKVSLAPLEEESLRKARPMDPEALKAYLKGRYYTELFTVEGFERAVASFERAIALEPDSELPHSGLAQAYVYRAFAGFGAAEDDWRRATDSVQRALEINPAHEQALGLSGTIKLLHDWDWTGAREQIDKALRENSRAALVLDNYSTLLMVTGKVEQGIDEHRSALAANPLSHDLSCSLVRKYYAAGRFDEAIEFGRSTADKFPTCPFEHLATAEALIQKGRYEEAVSHLEASLEIAVTDRALGRLGSAYWLSGRRQEALAVLERLLGMADADPYHIAPLYAAMGDRGAALEALERAYERRSVLLPFAPIEPAFRELRDEPRFVEVMRRMGLPAG